MGELGEVVDWGDDPTADVGGRLARIPSCETLDDLHNSPYID